MCAVIVRTPMVLTKANVKMILRYHGLQARRRVPHLRSRLKSAWRQISEIASRPHLPLVRLRRTWKARASWLTAKRGWSHCTSMKRHRHLVWSVTIAALAILAMIAMSDLWVELALVTIIMTVGIATLLYFNIRR